MQKPSIEISSLRKNEYQIVIQTAIRARPRALWAVLTDYDHHGDWLPYMTQSNVVARSRNVVFVQQVGQVRVIFITYILRVTQQVREEENRCLRFKAIEGDFEKLEGLWTISSGAPGEANLRCGFTMVPVRHPPAWAVRFVVKRYLAAMVERLRSRAEQQEALQSG